MGCSQSRSSSGAIATSDNGGVIGSIRKPPQQCDGYPPPLLPQYDTSSFVDVDFFVPVASPGSRASTTDDNDSPELAATFTWFKGDFGRDNVPALSSNDEISIKDVQNAIKSSASEDTPPPNVVIVCHGFLSWRNQMLISHVAAGVAKRMNCHAIRFDFRGNGSSGGTWRTAGYQGELKDLKRVVDYVRSDLGCKVVCIIGHSKGSAAVLRYARNQSTEKGNEYAIKVPFFVNMAGRFAVRGEFDPRSRFTEVQCDALSRTGQFQMKMFNDKFVTVTREDIDERVNADSSFVSEIDGEDAAVLTIHGSSDATVSVDNATKYDECILSEHKLKIIEGADHNFNGLKYIGDIVSSIAEFIES